MPSGSGSGIVHSATFTPEAAGRLIVTVTYEAQGAAGSAWGAAFRARVFATQSASTTYGEYVGMSDLRAAYTAQGVFDVVAGAAVECGLWGQISGAVSADFWNVSIRWELIKR
jgi:hypothetical protein